MKYIVGKIARILTIGLVLILALFEIIGFFAGLMDSAPDISTVLRVINLIAAGVSSIFFIIAIYFLFKKNKKYLIAVIIPFLLYVLTAICRLIFFQDEQSIWSAINNSLLFGLPVVLAALSYYLETGSNNSHDQLAQGVDEPFTPLQYQGILVRGSAYLIDNIIIAAPIFLVLYLLGLLNTEDYFWAFVGLVILVYKSATEAIWGKTVGKKILGLEVKMVNGANCSPLASVLRNIFLLVDLMFGFIIPLVVMTITPKRQRVGDLVAKTVVIKPA